MTDLVRPQHFENLFAIRHIGLVAGGTQRAGRCVGYQFQVVAGLLGEVQKLLVDDAAHAMHGAVDMGDLLKAPGLQRHADERLVDHSGGAATLGYQDFSRGDNGVFRVCLVGRC